MGTARILLFLYMGISLFQEVEASNVPPNQSELEDIWKKQHSGAQRVAELEFLCDVTHRSVPAPTSVHRLTPGDIKVIGAMGDSFTAGAGIKVISFSQQLTQNRGLSWSGGGEGTLEQFITLPNIFKKYNGHLWGYATGDGTEHSVQAHFNVAVVGSTSSGLVTQARMLIDRMKMDPNVDFVNDWKIITIQSGNIDLCYHCNKPELYNEEHFNQNLVRALDILHGGLPRTLVNLVEPLDIELLMKLHKELPCSKLPRPYPAPCECVELPKTNGDVRRLKTLFSSFQKIVEEITLSDRYNTTEDFAVVYQPLFSNGRLLWKEDGTPDVTYFSRDCLSLSNKGQAVAAITLWNNMVTPLQDKRSAGRKGTLWLTIKCPSQGQPYIYTARNSLAHQPLKPSASHSIRHVIIHKFLVVYIMSGIILAVIGSVIVAGVRRCRSQQLYVQIPN